MKLRERGVKCQNTSHITRATAFEPKGFLRKECFIIHTPLNILPLHKNAGSLSYCVTQDYVSYRQQKPTSNHHRRKQERKLRTHIPSPQEEPVWSWPSANRSQGLYFSPSLETWLPTVPGSSPAATARKPVGRTLTDLACVMRPFHPNSGQCGRYHCGLSSEDGEKVCAQEKREQEIPDVYNSSAVRCFQLTAKKISPCTLVYSDNIITQSIPHLGLAFIPCL